MLPFEITSLCCVWSRIKWHAVLRFAQTSEEEREKACKLNSNKILKVNMGVTKIFKDNLKGENEVFDETPSQ